MNRRAALIATMLLATWAGSQQLGAADPPRPATDLDALPLGLDDWRGRPGAPFDPAVLGLIGADDYVNRIYQSSSSIAGVYVGYHRAQKFGTTIHSPLNCLPGAGWQPLRTERIPFGTLGTATRVLIQKGEDRQMVLYWYQTAKRVEGNEYWSKLHLIADAFTSRRNDAALVRIVVPVDAARADGEPAALQTADRLARLVQPHVARLLFN
jgi:EpsI family protein